ncbi:hypothetical protein O7627_33035 [Solwaraspora sp. WMMD1047]|uniref:hypothetical protein n=1 Tax=Solwaraspora sp. WMMD1047 TaxID=3016102 RepID=UPI002417BDDB|nr:hypothetical protein [Solwaraspora sp. WMMD1047]MDG4834090.1 hypothetical protein [Solwaraspora sp. WMMD1047]
MSRPSRRASRTAARAASRAAARVHAAYRRAARAIDHQTVPGGSLGNALYRAAGNLDEACRLLRRAGPRLPEITPGPLWAGACTLAVVAASLVPHPILATAAAVGAAAAVWIVDRIVIAADRRAERRAADRLGPDDRPLSAVIAAIHADLRAARGEITTIRHALARTHRSHPDHQRAGDLVEVADILCGEVARHLTQQDLT